MLGGVVWRGDYEGRLAVSGAGESAYPDIGFAAWGGTWSSLWTPSYMSCATGIHVEASVQINPDGPASSVRVVIPTLGVDSTYSGTDTSLTVIISLTGLVLEVLPSARFRLRVGSLSVSVNGTVKFTQGSFSRDAMIGLAPSSIPLIGIPPSFGAGVGLDPILSAGALGDGYTGLEATGHATGTASGGWRVRPQGDGWVNPPLLVMPTGGLEFTPSGSDCYSVTVLAHIEQGDDSDGQFEKIGGGRVVLFPNWPAGVLPLTPESRALVLRAGDTSIKMQRSSGHTWTDESGSASYGGSSESTSPVHSARAPFLGVAPGVVEDNLGDAVYAIGAWGWSKLINTAHTSGSKWDHVSVPVEPRERGGLPSFLANADLHYDYLAEYNNTVANPHWLYSLWMPPDDAAMGVKWPLLGGASDREYWLQNRQQWQGHPALAGGGDMKRVHMVSEPMDQNALTGFVNGATGMPSFWALSQFNSHIPNWLSSVTLDVRSAPRWSWAGTGAIGDTTGSGTVDASGVTVTSGTTADFALGSWSVWPYMVTHRAKTLTLHAPRPNVAKVEAFLIAADGSAILIGKREAGEPDFTFEIPRTLKGKSATSMAQDFGAGELEDTYERGPDLKPAQDVSVPLSLDAETQTAMPLLPHGGGTRIRYVLTPVDASLPVSMKHPVYGLTSRGESRVVALSGGLQAVIAPSAPAIMYGAADHYDALLDAVVRDAGPTPMHDRQRGAFTALSYRRLWLEGRGWDDGVDAEIASLYESGTEYTLRKHLERDPEGGRTTASFLSEGAGGPLVVEHNTYRSQVPPLACFPRRKRTKESDWQETGLYGLWSYTLTEPRMWHVTPEEPKHVLVPRSGETSDAGNVLTDGPGVAGWNLRQHEPMLTNDEGYDWTLRKGGKRWFRVRPWRGGLHLIGGAPGLGAGDVAVSVSGRWAWGRIEEGSAQLSFSGGFALWTPWDAAGPEGVDRLRVCYRSADGALLMLVRETASEGWSLWARQGESAGTMALIATLGPGAQGDLCEAPNNITHAYRLDAGAVVLHRFDARGQAVGGPVSTSLSGLDEEPIGVDAGIFDGRLLIRITYVLGGERQIAQSTDGIEFS